MAPTTRTTNRDITPDRHIANREYDTVQKSRFYRVYDEQFPRKSLRSISRSEHIPESSARKLLHQRKLLGSAVYRRTRPQSHSLGPRERVSHDTYQMLVSTSNPVRDQPYEVQIESHQLPIKKRALQTGLRRHTKGGQRYKQAYIQKTLSARNRATRVDYGQKYQHETVDSFWQYVYFTNEAHIDPTSQDVSYILREEGTRYEPNNIQERPTKEGIKLHVAGWCNWHSKCDQLEFYNDEEEYTFRPQARGRPRRSRYEDNVQYTERIRTWEAERPHERIVVPKGNGMTQKYYTERLLLRYIDAIHTARVQNAYPWVLQEDNDPSHGTRKQGLASKLRDTNWIPVIVHPAQSPDLSPIEACWNILKQRVRKRTWRTLEELKEIVQSEWQRITMDEVRARIAEMPGRCRMLIETGGRAIRSEMW
jgi:hypothetical protein